MSNIVVILTVSLSLLSLLAVLLFYAHRLIKRKKWGRLPLLIALNVIFYGFAMFGLGMVTVLDHRNINLRLGEIFLVEAILSFAYWYFYLVPFPFLFLSIVYELYMRLKGKCCFRKISLGKTHD